MAYISKEEVKQIIEKRPSNVTPAQVIDTLVNHGHTLEGYEKVAKVREEQQPTKKTLTEKIANVGDFLGMGALGRGAGLAAFQLTPESKALEESARKETELNASVPRETILRLQREGKPLPGQGQPNVASQMENITTDGITNRQVIGSAVSTAGLAVGSAIKTPATLAGRVGLGAILGSVEGGAQATAKGANTKEALEAAGTGAVVGAALPVAAEAGRKVLKGVGTLVSKTLGITTGIGGDDAIRRAFLNPDSPELVEAMRGRKTATTVLGEARDALQEMRTQRAKTYQVGLKELNLADKQMSLDPVKEEVEKQLKNFNITRTKDGLDFSASKIADTAEQNRLKGLIDSVDTWADKSALGIDTLKQRMDDFYSPSSKVRAFVGSVKGKVKRELIDNVSGYEKMTQKYATDTNLIDELESLAGDNKSQDTAIRKLSTVLRRNEDFRRNILQRVEKATGANLTDALAGLQLNKIEPQGLARYLLGVDMFRSLADLAVSPTEIARLVVELTASSPRAVGEIARGLGMVIKKTVPVREAVDLGSQKLLPGLLGFTHRPEGSSSPQTNTTNPSPLR